jgi:hypothetical protein
MQTLTNTALNALDHANSPLIKTERALARIQQNKFNAMDEENEDYSQSPAAPAKQIMNAMKKKSSIGVTSSPLKDVSNSPRAVSSRGLSSNSSKSMIEEVDAWKQLGGNLSAFANNQRDANTPTRFGNTARAKNENAGDDSRDRLKVLEDDDCEEKSNRTKETQTDFEVSAAAQLKKKTENASSTRELVKALVRQGEENERVKKMLECVKDAEIEMYEIEMKRRNEFEKTLERTIKERYRAQARTKEKEIENMRTMNSKAIETFTNRIQGLEIEIKERDVRIQHLEARANEWQVLAKKDATRAESETLGIDRELKAKEKKIEELNVVINTLLGKANQGQLFEKDLTEIRMKQMRAKSVATNTNPVRVAHAIQLKGFFDHEEEEEAPSSRKPKEETHDVGTQYDHVVELFRPQQQQQQQPTTTFVVKTPVSVMKRKMQVQENALNAIKKEIEERERCAAATTSTTSTSNATYTTSTQTTPKEPSPTIGFTWTATTTAAQANVQVEEEEEVTPKFGGKVVVEQQQQQQQAYTKSSKLNFDDEQQHWVPTPNTRKHVEEKYAAAVQKHPGKVTTVVDRFHSLTPIRAPREPVQRRVNINNNNTSYYSRENVDDQRMAKIARAMNISDSPFVKTRGYTNH